MNTSLKVYIRAEVDLDDVFFEKYALLLIKTLLVVGFLSLYPSDVINKIFLHKPSIKPISSLTSLSF